MGWAEDGARPPALYEPVHGSAPNIAGQGKANPLAAILSFAMLLRHSLGRGEDAQRLESAVVGALQNGVRTADIMEAGKKEVTTVEMGDAVLHALEASN